MRCGLGLDHEGRLLRCGAASQPSDETHRGCPRRAPGASRGTAREIRGAVAGKGRMLARVCAPACWSGGNAGWRLPPASGFAAKAGVHRERGSWKGGIRAPFLLPMAFLSGVRR